MSMSKRFDKKNATTFAVVHRSHEDAKYYDNDASEHVLVPVVNPNQSRKPIKTKKDLETEFQDEIKQGKIRSNEGEAAAYGITYDDSKYDYMQHLKPIGGNDAGVFIAKKEKPVAKKGIDLKHLEDVLPSGTRKVDFQEFQAVPTELTGFQPDMNPALREVLEALEDEAYVDNEDEDVFGDLLGEGEIVDEEEFEGEFDEWDMDNYADEMEAFDEAAFTKPDDQGWEADFRMFKKEQQMGRIVNDWDTDDEFDEEEEEDDFDTVGDLPTFKATGKKAKQKERRKKGAMTDVSSFSMSSSALFRSEAQTVLDDRMDRVFTSYENYQEEAEAEFEKDMQPFDMENERDDFESMLDDFLDNYELEKGGRKLVKKNEEISNLKKAADSVSKSKLAARRRKEAELSDKLSALKF